MSKAEERLKEISDKLIGNTGKRALVVEGEEDADAVKSFLATKRTNSTNPNSPIHSWEKNWEIVAAGKKATVLDIIKLEENWIGVVDRDEWTQQKIAQYENQLDNLCVLPRYCIESYLIVPNELWTALPPSKQTKVSDGLQGLDKSIKSDIARWRCYGVLWSVINPLRENLRAKGFTEALFNFDIATNEAEIKKILAEWHDFLQPEAIWKQYQELLADVRQKSEDEQLKLWIHGKKFFEQFVTPILNQHLGQQSAKDHRKEIFRTLPVPADLDRLWEKMGLSSLT